MDYSHPDYWQLLGGEIQGAQNTAQNYLANLAAEASHLASSQPPSPVIATGITTPAFHGPGTSTGGLLGRVIGGRTNAYIDTAIPEANRIWNEQVTQNQANTTEQQNLLTNYNAIQQGYGELGDIFNNAQNWQGVGNTINTQLTDSNVTNTPQFQEALALLARRGLLGSNQEKALYQTLPNISGDFSRMFQQGMDQYAGLRNQDLQGYSTLLRNQLASGEGGSDPSLFETARNQEQGNYDQAIDFVSQLSVGDSFNRFIQGIKNASRASPVASQSVGGLTAYSSDLASPSQTYQQLPDQEFASVFNDGSEKRYKGKGS